MEVLISEHSSFPVEPGKDTLEACLNNVRQSDAYVLLIGQRFGSLHSDHPGKSITWLEWEQASASGLNPIVLIEETALEECRKVRAARARLTKNQPALTRSQQDNALRLKFKDQGDRQGIVDVDRFVAAVEATKKWIEMTWDGSAAEAIKHIERRLGDFFAGYRRTNLEFEQQLRRQRARMDALARTVDVAAVYTGKIRGGSLAPRDAAAALVKMVGNERGVLLDFEAEERFSIGLHTRNWRGDAVPDPDVRDAAGGVKSRGRTWRKNQSHVSLAIERNEILVSEDVRSAEGWFADPDPRVAKDDRENYVSIISVPFYLWSGVRRAGTPSERPNAALTLTSSRRGHFRELEGPVELTFRVLSRIVSEVLNAGNGAS
jgi:hypothetical protein